MNDLSIIFLIVNAIVLVTLPRRWAPLPLLIGTCYTVLSQRVEISVFSFTIIRVLIAVGVARVIIRGERLGGGMNGLDWLMLVWAAWALVSSIFHKNPSQALIFRLGLIYNACGIYFLLRAFCHSLDDIKNLCCILSILLVPVAFEMVYEQLVNHNLFQKLAGGLDIPSVRAGRIRSSGPFSHPILAGTVGAVSLPLIVGLWQQNRKLAIMGIAACSIMIITCVSSGPIMSAVVGIAALYMWRYRQYMRHLIWVAAFIVISLSLVMKAPIYYIIYRFNITGGSAGWYRGALIESAISHFDEWWFAGTDYTRHWMTTGVQWSPDQVDITNHYLYMGVLGGLPLMFLFIAILAKGFSLLGKTFRDLTELRQDSQFMLWALGASLFVHAATFISVSYYDQSFIFIYLSLAAISSVSVNNSISKNSFNI